jgi:AcrR family transcriptional regulator
MARTVDRERRRILLERAADHLLERGLISVTLRELAEALGVSPRMLVHHFGSRDALIARALAEARSRQRAVFEAHLAPRPGRPYADVLVEVWQWFSTDEARPYLRLFGQLHSAAQTPDSLYADFARRSVVDWLPVIEHGFASDGVPREAARELATLTVAVVRGLLQDGNAGGDAQRISAAFDRFIAMLRAATHA